MSHDCSEHPAFWWMWGSTPGVISQLTNFVTCTTYQCRLRTSTAEAFTASGNGKNCQLQDQLPGRDSLRSSRKSYLERQWCFVLGFHRATNDNGAEL